MQKFTVTEHKTTWEYELCDSSDSSGNKCLKITQYRKGKYVDEEVVDLSEINPEFFEVQIEKKSPSRMRIPVYCAGGFIWFSSLIVFLALGSWEHMFVAVATWMIPPIIGWRLIISSQYAVKPRFYFGEQGIPKITVPYTDKKRPETLQFVQTIASFCHQKRNVPQQLPVMKHQFANGLAELRDMELVLFNKYGIKSTACTYDDVSFLKKFTINPRRRAASAAVHVSFRWIPVATCRSCRSSLAA